MANLFGSKGRDAVAGFLLTLSGVGISAAGIADLGELVVPERSDGARSALPFKRPDFVSVLMTGIGLSVGVGASE